VAVPAATGQEADKEPPRKGEAAPPVLRQLYAVRGEKASDLAKALSLHFQGERAFRAVPDAGSNSLLLSGPRAALEEAGAGRRPIARPARPVGVEVLLLELTGKAGEGGGDAREGERPRLSGPARDVLARVRALQQKGAVAGVKTVELTALAGQTARSKVSESR